MCFFIKENTEKLTEKARARKTDIVAYKVVSLKNGKYKSYFMDKHEWKKGLNKSSRRAKNITPTELFQGNITAGFHLLKTKYSVFKQYEWLLKTSDLFVVIACSIKPSDIVAVNNSEIVAKNATLIKEVQV